MRRFDVAVVLERHHAESGKGTRGVAIPIGFLAHVVEGLLNYRYNHIINDICHLVCITDKTESML